MKTSHFTIKSILLLALSSIYSLSYSQNYGTTEKKLNQLLFENKHTELVSEYANILNSKSNTDIYYAVNELRKTRWFNEITLKNQLSPQALTEYEIATEIADFYNQDDYKKIYDKYKFEDVLVIDAYTTNLFLYAINRIDYTKTIDYYHQALKKYPNNIFILNRGRNLSNNFHFYDSNQKKLASGNYPKETLDFFNEIYVSKNFSTYQTYNALKKYGAYFPENGYAQYLLGNFAYNLEYYELAESYHQKAHNLLPVSLENTNEYLKVLSRLNKSNVFSAKVEQFAKAYGENKHYIAAQAYYDERHYGKTRDELEKITEPDAQHYFLFGKLENHSNQNEKALDFFKKSYDKKATDKNYISSYFKALAKVRPNEAISFYTNRLSQAALNEQLFYEVSTFLSESKEEQLALDQTKKWTETLPSSSWAWNNYAENLITQKDYRKALDAIHKSFEVYKPYGWSVGKFVEIQNNINGNDKNILETELKKLLEKYPETEAIWDELEKLLANDDEKIRLWEKAIEQLPDELFPVTAKRHLLTQNKKWKEAVDFLENLNINQKINSHELFFQKAIVNLLKSRNHSLSETEFEYTKNNFDHYLDAGGYPGAYHQYLRELYASENDDKNALYHSLNEIKYRPGNQTPYWLIATKYISQKQDAFTDYKELLYRNPYDKENFRRLIDLEVRWNGSPINGYFSAQQFKQNFPDNVSEIQSLENDALSALGSSIDQYTNGYLNYTVISNSKRYVNWLKSSRGKALKGTSLVEFDKISNSVTILLPDGTIFSRTDDPRLSKIKKIQIGDQYISADYDLKGNLTEIKNSNGNFLKLEYDQNQKIDKMTQNETVLTFEYNEIGKPTKITIQGVGEMNVEYDESGEMTKVESEQGPSMALKVTQEFQKLNGYTNSLRTATNISNLKLPDLGMVDKKYEELKEAYGNSKWTEQKNSRQKAAYNLALYLYNNSHTDSDYNKEGITLINDLSNDMVSMPKDKNQEKLNIDVVNLYYNYMDKYKKNGIAIQYWNDWTQVKKWIDKEVYLSRGNKSYFEQLYQLQQKIQNNPIRLLAFDEWLPKSDLQNRSYWNKHSLQDVLPKELVANTDIVDVHYRKNGDLIILTKTGLAIKKNGYWDYYQYNALRNSFVEYDNKNPLKAQFTHNNLTESDNGTLYLATTSGILVIEDEVTGIIRRIGSFEGLPIDNINHLVSFNNTVIVGSANAVYVQEENEWRKIDTYNEQIRQLYSSKDNEIWILTDKSVYQYTTKTQLKKVISDSRNEIIRVNEEYFTRKNSEIFKLEQSENGEYLEFKTIGNVVTTSNSQVYGMNGFIVNNNEIVLGVLTDLGISFFKENHFEHFYVDLVGKPAVVKSTSFGNDMFLRTSEGLYEFSKQKSIIFNGKVNKLLYNPFDNITYTIIDNRLYYLDKNNKMNTLGDGYYERYSNLVIDKNGYLIANEGSLIKRIKYNKEYEKYEFEELFYAENYVPKDHRFDGGEINDIFVDKENAIWVVSDVSVFKYEENQQGDIRIQEYNFFKNAEAFPSYTHYNYKIYQDLSDNIYLVASDEGHLYYRNQQLKGGLLKYNPEKNINAEDGTIYYGIFERIETSNDYNWFVNSYTKIDEQTAILGTGNGFALEKYGLTKSFRNLNEPSYIKLFENKKALYLGTEGASLGDLWLFGSEVGVLGYWNNSWFFPEKINALLPQDIESGKYGGRAITSIASDKKGTVYIGTNLGLLVYDSGSEDPSGFFFDNNLPNNGVQTANASVVQSESLVVLNDLPKNSNSGKLVEEINQTKKEIEKLNTLNHKELPKLNEDDKAESFVKREEIAQQLQALQKRQAEILLTLEQTEPAVFQALTIPPLDLQSSRAKLNSNDVVVQYIPLSKKLFINLVYKDKTLLKEVNITSDSLESIVNKVLPYLRSENVRGSIVQNTTKESTNQSEKNLQTLYDILIKPIKKDIESSQNILIVPGKFLHYLPFSALNYEDSNRKKRYAIQDHVFGYVSSLYLFNLVYDFKENTDTGKSLIVADPDGTLQGALKEGETIANLTQNNILLKGRNATIGNFTKNATEVKSIHLATHGFLKEESIKDSWLIFSDKKMLMSDIYSLNLSKVNYVVLSACQTAYGRNGLEYAHLGRAFANAGAPSVVATLWSVNDDASEKLIVDFYKNLNQNNGKYRAMALAQRMMIEQNNQYSHPAMWAGYITIGKD